MPCPTQDADLFRRAMENTRRCMKSVKGDNIVCENAILSEGKSYTWHPHPNSTPAPSDIDIATTKKYGKEFLCIGLVNSNKTICFHRSDNFKKPVCKF